MNTVIDYIKKLLEVSMFLALRWETPIATPSTGITAVMRGELRAFHRRGVFIAPWQRKMKQAQSALTNGKVRDTGIAFNVSGAPHHDNLVVRVLLAENVGQAPVIYLAPDPENAASANDLKFFGGSADPYDTPCLRDDAVFFARAVDRFAGLVDLPMRLFAYAADWETVLAMAALHRRGHLTVLHVHNIYDQFLGPDLVGHSFPGAELFHRQTVLKAGLRLANVRLVVNRGYAWGLQREPLYTRVIADHLQDEVKLFVPLDNAPFVQLSPELRQLEEDLSADVAKGLANLEKLKAKARLALPADIQKKIEEKVLCVSMGRRVSQKGHDVAIAAVRNLLRENPNLPAFFFFATTQGDETSAIRLQRINQLAEEFPENVGYSDGHLSYFNELMAAADFNMMPSALGEPHGGSFQGYVIPIARGVDGLAVQICSYQPKGPAAKLNTLWHPPTAIPSGFTFREIPLADENQTIADLRDLLLNATPAPENETFNRMVSALTETVSEAIRIKLNEPLVIAQLTLGALRAQMLRTSEMNLGGVLSLVDAARLQQAA